jgi:hypothetical protein
MTGLNPIAKSLVSALFFACAPSAFATETATTTRSLILRTEVMPVVLDYELPGHPNTRGRGHVGIVSRASLLWRHDQYFSLEAGAMLRVPFAHDFWEELGALPILSLVVLPFDHVLLRFGTLDDRHGYHPALVDEDRYRYGRNYEESYNRGIVPEAHRDLGGDPFMPAEHGMQLKVASELLHGEVFLDWELLETEEHREKFAFGILAGLTHEWVDVDFQFRLIHYGGELFTKADPIRFAQLDPVRQPIAFGATATLKPPYIEVDGVLRFEIPLAFMRGRIAQAPGAEPTSHYGFEVGADAVIYEAARVGYRAWFPNKQQPGFLSEDGDPVYSGRRSHRVRLALATQHGDVELSGRLDLLVADGSEKVQYETVTVLTFRYEPLLWSR